MVREPLFEVAQLAHVELVTPNLDASHRFFSEILGMQETTRAGQSIYLRAYEDLYHHSLKLTEGPAPGLGHVAWRTTSPQALERRVQVLKSSGLGRGWVEGENGHGPAYRFTTPDGHPMELLWEVEYYQAPEHLRSVLRNRPQLRPLQGIPVRRIDHVNCFASGVGRNRAFLEETLGFRLRENRLLADGREVGAFLSVSPLVHEIGLVHDRSDARGRFHHVCYWYGYLQHLWDVADICRERGITLEAGPGRHGPAETAFLYLHEPGGNRIELMGNAGYLIFDPDWKPVVWQGDDVALSTNWYEGRMPESFYTQGTPLL